MNHKRQTHNCNELFKDISLMLDGELDRHSVNKLKTSIEHCNTCQQFYHQHLAYKKNIYQKVIRKACGSDLKESIRSSIRGL